jgi:hypothetical protein
MLAEKVTESDETANASQKVSAVHTASVRPGAEVIDRCFTGLASGTAFATKPTTVPAFAGVEFVMT